MKLKLWFPFACVALLAVGSIVGCGNQPVSPVVGLNSLSYFSVDKVNGAAGVCTDLLAGQTIKAGTVCFEVDANSVLHVTYTTTGGWQLTEAHFWVGCSPTGYPMTKTGNPVPGQFPYKSGNITGATTYTFAVDLKDPQFAGCLGTLNCTDGNVLFAMSHAALRKVDNNGNVIDTQTGWGNGTGVVAKGSWATQTTLTLFDDSCRGSTPKCYAEAGTAFAFGGDAANCFSSYPDALTNDVRWGWTNGPLTAGTYTWPIYVGAAQCDLSKGTNVGTATVNIASDGTVNVTYNINGPYTLAETHVYVGCDPLPKQCTGPPTNQTCESTVAPGRFGNQHTFTVTDGVTSDSYTISAGGCSSGYYVILHAKVMQQVSCQ